MNSEPHTQRSEEFGDPYIVRTEEDQFDDDWHHVIEVATGKVLYTSRSLPSAYAECAKWNLN